MFGSATKASSLRNPDSSTSRTEAPAVRRVTAPAPRLITRPSIARRRSGRVGAITSMRRLSSASRAVNERLLTTAASASCTVRPVRPARRRACAPLGGAGVEPLAGGERAALDHRRLGELHVAAIARRQGADVGRGVLLRLLAGRPRDVLPLSAPPVGGGGA